MRELLQSGLSALGLPASEDQVRRLLGYAEEITHWNRRGNLVRAEGDGLVTRHLLDSLAGLSAVREHARVGRVADAGSGAGLPGIPLAIMAPEIAFDLIERSARRVAFLRNAALLLGLDNARVLEADVGRMKDRYAVVVTRAFAPLSEAAALPLLEPGGLLIVYAGRMDGIQDQVRRLPPSARLLEIRPIAVPGLEAERHLVLIERVLIPPPVG